MVTLPDTELLPTIEAARRASVSYPTLKGWISIGYLPSVRIGQQRYVRADHLAEAQRNAHAGDVVPAWRADPKRVGQRLRLLREAAGMRQLDLAAASGVTNEAISRLERGKRPPYAETVVKLARALAVPLDRLHRWLREGVLPASKVSGEWRIPVVAVAELERSGRLRGESRRLDPRYRG